MFQRSLRRRTGWVLMVLVALAMGPSGQTVSPLHATVRTEEVDLRAEVNELRRQAAMAEVELAHLRRRVHQLELLLAGGAEGGASRSIEVENAVSGSEDEAVSTAIVEVPAPAGAPRGPEIEESELSAEEMGSDLADSAVELPAIEPAATERPVQTSAATPSADSDPAPVEVATPVLSPVIPEARLAYDEAYTLYHQGAFVEAEAEFLRFLAMGQVNELSDNAMFWVGSARYARGDYPGALRAFRETVETYPDQNKVPDALFKIGQCLEKVGDRENAEEVYRELSRRFPETAAATLAGERLSNP